MTRCKTFIRAAGALALAAAPCMLPAPAAAAMPVFDATNYAQNLLQAARALDQVNNQIKSLQNQASMIEAMGRNLQRIDFPQLEALTSAMKRVDQLMGKAQGIDFKVGALDRRIEALFPGTAAAIVGRDRRVADARARLDAATAAYKQSMGVQAQVVENVRADAATLAELAGASQGSVGALQAAQAANQLLALSVKQLLQLQDLLTAEHREASLDRARRAQAQADGRAATLRFLGVSTASRR